METKILNPLRDGFKKHTENQSKKLKLQALETKMTFSLLAFLSDRVLLGGIYGVLGGHYGISKRLQYYPISVVVAKQLL